MRKEHSVSAKEHSVGAKEQSVGALEVEIEKLGATGKADHFSTQGFWVGKRHVKRARKNGTLKRHVKRHVKTARKKGM